MLRKIRNIFYGGHHVQVNGDYNQNVYQHATSVDITVRKEEGTSTNDFHRNLNITEISSSSPQKTF